MSGETKQADRTVISGRIRRISVLVIAIGLIWAVVGIVLWSRESGNGFVVENRRTDNYTNLEMGSWRRGLHNTVRTCSWSPAEVVRDEANLLAPDGNRVELTPAQREGMMATRLVYSVEHQCIAPLVSIYTDYEGRLRRCGANENCGRYEHSEMMTRASILSFHKMSFLDCRNADGYPLDNCTPTARLADAIARDLREMEEGSPRSDAQIERDARSWTNACVAVSGEVCNESDVFVRSDWESAARDGGAYIGAWIAALGALMLAIGPVLFFGIQQFLRYIWR